MQCDAELQKCAKQLCVEIGRVSVDGDKSCERFAFNDCMNYMQMGCRLSLDGVFVSSHIFDCLVSRVG